MVKLLCGMKPQIMHKSKQGADYIFLDEVSKISCSDKYEINSQLAKALNEFELPYGGMNMIFSGDFAQLPPVFGSPLYSGTVGTQLMSHMTVQGQEAAKIGCK